MAENSGNPFRPLSPSHPPSPHMDAYPQGSPRLPYDDPYEDDHDRNAGFVAPSHQLRPYSAAGTPPNLDELPIPISYLDNVPPGAQPPQRFYGTVDGERPRYSFASSTPTLEQGGRPYNDSDYDSVARLRVDSNRASMATFPGQETPRFSPYGSYHDDPNASHLDLQMEDLQNVQDKRNLYVAPDEQRRKRVRMLTIIGVIIILLVIGAAVAVYFFVIKPHSSNSSGGGNNSTSSSSSQTSTGGGTNNLVTHGGDGSTVTYDDGTTGTYHNAFGGTWYYDPNDPYNNNAQAQSYTPPLNQSFDFAVDRIYGVNLGGWLNTEPFISPALYEPYLNAATPAVDEWTLCTNMVNDPNGGFNILTKHYDTFITEEDFAQIAAAGLNWVRIAIPYWAIAKFADEPFLSGVQWPYFVKAIEWARKYGIRINLDLHAHPGSQNGFNHAGKLGAMNWMYGTMGIANAQRSLEIIRTIAEFISQPQYKEVVGMFGLVNEPQVYLLGTDVVAHFYVEAHNLIRNITGRGAGNGPWLTIHDGFDPTSDYNSYLSGGDRVALDTHPYLCFQKLLPLGPADYAKQPCTSWGTRINGTYGAFGYVHAGEWSLGYTDCGLFLNNVGIGTRYEGNNTLFPSTKIGNCRDILDYTTWTPAYKQGLQALAFASMDVLHNWFFWTWKIGNSSVTNQVESPHWSYQLGIQGGWLPKDPRSAAGTCAQQGVQVPIAGPLTGWMTGGPGAGTFSPSVTQSYGQWPPASMSAVEAVAGLPIYVQTGTPLTLTAPAPTGATTYTPTATISPGNGWADPSDTIGAYVPIDGCNYPDPWNAVSSPAPQCTPHAKKRRREDEAELWAVNASPAPLPTITAAARRA